jgi:cell division protein FtsB
MEPTSITPADLGKLILALVTLAPILTALGYFLGRKRIVEIGNTLKTETIAGVATRDELAHLTARVDKLETTVEKLRDDIGDQYEKILSAGDRRAKDLRDYISQETGILHNRINVIATATATIQGYIEAKRKNAQG